MNYTPIIGLEIHVELRTQSKMFCDCPANHFGKTPNTQTCPVCLGLPGALPVPNHKAVTWTQLIGLALNCRLLENSKFDRKHYFYPDLSKGYQISQYDEPLCAEGYFELSNSKVHITRVHLEEDTGKLQHTTIQNERVSLIDFNRSGVPLVEIVSEPELHTAASAKEYAQKIQQLIRYLAVSDADMEKGSMRLEANISLSSTSPNDPTFSLPPYKVEVKNINSFRFLEKAIKYEINRQSELLDQGTQPIQETRGFNEAKNATVSQRTKEEAKDYRYFPEPDIPPMVFSTGDLHTIRQLLPKLPNQYQTYFKEKGIRPDFTHLLSQSPDLAHLAEIIIEKSSINPQDIASFLINKKVHPQTTDVETVIKALEATTHKATSSREDMLMWITESIAAHPELVEKYRTGKTAVIGAFVGDIMNRSHGKADPSALIPLLKKKLV